VSVIFVKSLTKIGMYQQIVIKMCNTKFDENPDKGFSSRFIRKDRGADERSTFVL
jgi:hypothetical protein